MATARISAVATKPVFAVYTCSQCGTNNLVNGAVAGTSSVVVGGYGKKRKIANAKERASTEAEQSLEESKRSAVRLAQNQNYDAFHLNGVCSKCQHREPWAYHESKLENAVSIALAVLLSLSLILGIVCLCLEGFSKTTSVFFMIFGAALLLMLVCFMIGKWKDKKKAAEIAALPEKSRPLVAFSMLELAAKAQEEYGIGLASFSTPDIRRETPGIRRETRSADDGFVRRDLTREKKEEK